MLKTRKIQTILTSYNSLNYKYRSLVKEKGEFALATKVCKNILSAVYSELKRYSEAVGLSLRDCFKYACVVDLSSRHYLVDVYPYVYGHPDTYTIIDDGLDVIFFKLYKNEKKDTKNLHSQS